MKIFRNLRLRTKLILMVLTLMVLTLSTAFFTYSHYEKLIMGEVQNQSEDLSKFFEIGVQQLTSKAELDQPFLEDYVRRLSKKGVKEIAILSSERTVVASSNQAKVGKKIHAKGTHPGRPLVISGTFGDDEDQNAKIAYNLEIPIIVDDQKQGYLRLKIILDDFAVLLRKIYWKRTLATSVVFLGGLGAAVIFAYRLTSPLERLAAAADRIGAGDLDVEIRVESSDEIGKLQKNFGGMIEKLREKRRLESQLRRAERASSIGRLASAVAHEIRNPLNYINLSIDHLKSSYRPAQTERNEEFDQSLDQIKAEIQRVNTLVTEFLNFGRPPRLQITSCPVDELLAEVRRFALARAESQGVSVDLVIEPGLSPVAADPEGLRTCFLNLLTNALQAMPKGGRIELDARQDGPSTVVVFVRDDGPGIADRDVDRIFDPYFSTKETGVGLGLAITQRILQDHGGEIRVTSRPGSTEFRVALLVEGPLDQTTSTGRATAANGDPT